MVVVVRCDVYSYIIVTILLFSVYVCGYVYIWLLFVVFFFFFYDSATTQLYTPSLPDAPPIF